MLKMVNIKKDINLKKYIIDKLKGDNVRKMAKSQKVSHVTLMNRTSYLKKMSNEELESTIKNCFN